ncbi:MAG: CoA transferase [Dehalococcoidales bacterium]|nr:CoA transferase [Dehalococcoidales bacterium]
MGNFLTGIRVLAMEQILAGPFGSMLLGDLGAEIIKIEPPGGEISRHQAGPSYKGESNYYLAFNRNKKSIVLDLKTKSGKQAFYDLVKISDIVWDNHRAGAMKRLGADYDTLKKINPKIICCNITGWGMTGPYKDYTSYDLMAQAVAGILSVTGEPGGPPIKPGPSIADIAGATFGTIGVLAALAARERTGEGQKIEINLLDGAMAMLCFHYTWYFISGENPIPVGSGHINTVPLGAYKAKDGWVALGPCWPRITRVIGQEWMIDDPRFSTGDARLKNRTEVNQIVSDGFSKFSSADLIELLRAEDIACAPVNTLDKAAVDPQIVNNNMVITLPHPLGGEIKLVGQPIKAPDRIDEKKFTAPPTLGQHTDAVLSELLHYSGDKIKALKEEEVANTEKREERLHKKL